MEELQLIPSLLHDARLVKLHYEPDLASLRLTFGGCLRRDRFGKPIDAPVEIQLHGVEQIIAWYNPANFEVRPSKLVVAIPSEFLI